MAQKDGTAHILPMHKGRRNTPNIGGALNPSPAVPPLWAVILYDGPVILERALQLFDGIHQSTNPRRRIRVDTLPLNILNDRSVNLYARRSLARAQMIVVAVKASPGLAFPAIRHLEDYLDAGNPEKRALLAFLEGRSPEARNPGSAFDQLQKIAERQGVDFLAHIADPAPYSPWPYVPRAASSETVSSPE